MWAAAVDTYCPSRTLEHSKYKSTQLGFARRCIALYSGSNAAGLEDHCPPLTKFVAKLFLDYSSFVPLSEDEAALKAKGQQQNKDRRGGGSKASNRKRRGEREKGREEGSSKLLAKPELQVDLVEVVSESRTSESPDRVSS